MNVNQLFAARLETLQAVRGSGESLKWKGVSYACSMGSETSGHELEFGGQLGYRQRSATLARSLFGNGPYPAHGDEVWLTPATSAKAVRYRVVESLEIGAGAFVKLTLKDPNEK